MPKAAQMMESDWTGCVSINHRFGVPALAGPDRLKAGHQTNCLPQSRSWSQCTASKSWGLSMNREVVARASRPCVGRTNRTGETPVPQFRRNGSWSRSISIWNWGLSMHGRSGRITGRSSPQWRGDAARRAPRLVSLCFWAFGIRASFVICHLSLGITEA
jgi:hypothetical protein